MIPLLLALAAFAQDGADVQPDGGLETFLASQRAQWPDRGAPPPVAPATPWEQAAWAEHRLDNGVRVLHVPIEGLRKVSVQVRRRTAPELLSLPPALRECVELQGTATERHDQEALESALTLLDAELDVDSLGVESTDVWLTVPRDELEPGLSLLAEVLYTPVFPKSEVRRWLRNERFFWGQQLATDASTLADVALRYGWYQPDTPQGTRRSAADYGALDPKDLRTLAAQLNTDAPVDVLIVGDVSWDALQPMLSSTLAAAPGPKDTPAPAPLPTSTRAPRFIAVDVPGAEQAVVRYRLPAPPRGDADRLPFEALQWAYGGTFLSRLNRVLREDKGWTYGSYSSDTPHAAEGEFTVGYDTGVDTAADAIEQTLTVLHALRGEGCTADELSGAWRESVAGWNQAALSASTAGSFYGAALEADLTVDQARERLVAAGEVTTDTTRDVAGRWFADTQPGVWVVVGDRERLEPELAALGWTWEWYSAQQVARGLTD